LPKYLNVLLPLIPLIGPEALPQPTHALSSGWLTFILTYNNLSLLSTGIELNINFSSDILDEDRI